MSDIKKRSSQIVIKQRVRCGEMDSQFRKRLIRKIKTRSRARTNFIN